MTTNPLEPRDSRTFAIIGAAMEVHRVLGSGFLELFYRDALAIEFGLRDVPFAAEVPCNIVYKDHQLRGHYRMDFVCFDSVVVEVKAGSGTGPAEHAQVLNYLASTGYQCGLLLNFGLSKLEYRRFVLTKPRWAPGTDHQAPGT
ncbi:MAG: GxxExxY protein [Vicinamibacterales bacterium]|jgi:GxxExxY protein